MNLATLTAAAPPPRARRKKTELDPAEKIRREAIVGRARLDPGQMAAVAAAFGISDRTLRRWARELVASN